jgi:hypothetical protein
MEITHPKVDLSSGSGIAASASLGGSRNNIPYSTFFQNDEVLSNELHQHQGYNGFICLTELRGTRFFESTITSSKSVNKEFTYEIYNTGSDAVVTTTRGVTASYFYPFTNYQFSVLRSSPTLILNLDFDSELPSYAGIKGFALIPNQSTEKIKDNFEYYLEKAGLLTKTVKFKSPRKGR